MVKREIIEEIIGKSINVVSKCGPTLKQRLSAFNPKDFKSEKYSRKEGQIKSAEKSPVGALQKLQEDLQDEVDYNNEEKSMLNHYTVDFWAFTSYFYHIGLFSGDTLQFGKDTGWMLDCYKWDWGGKDGRSRVFKEPPELIDFNIRDFTDYDAQSGHYSDGRIQEYDKYLYTIPFLKGIEVLDNMIDKSPPLQQNTILYRVGVFDESLKPGDTSKWKSYTSTSFNSYVAKNGLKKYAGFNPGKDCYQLKIYAPQGTKGVVPCQNTGCEDWQSEFTLGRNQKYMVISVDHLNKTAEILLY